MVGYPRRSHANDGDVVRVVTVGQIRASTPLICFRCGPGLRVPEASDINPSLHNALGQMTAARQEYH
ncbi:hypothetical protein AFLA_011180 [Aspergillus flavus NRRL3357]|nr:hypothetical protein AFLA_011180 [Aspergillus flavus NRRL3357]